MDLENGATEWCGGQRAFEILEDLRVDFRFRQELSSRSVELGTVGCSADPTLRKLWFQTRQTNPSNENFLTATGLSRELFQYIHVEYGLRECPVLQQLAAGLSLTTSNLLFFYVMFRRHFRTFRSAALAMDVGEIDASKIIKQVLKVLTEKFNEAVRAPTEEEFNSIETRNSLLTGTPNHSLAVDSYPYKILSKKATYDSHKYNHSTVKAVVLQGANRVFALDILAGNRPDFEIFKPASNIMKAMANFPEATRPIQLRGKKIRKSNLVARNFALCDRDFGEDLPRPFLVDEKGHLRKQLVELDHSKIKNGDVYTRDLDVLKQIIQADVMFYNIQREHASCLDDLCNAFCQCKIFNFTYKEPRGQKDGRIMVTNHLSNGFGRSCVVGRK